PAAVRGALDVGDLVQRLDLHQSGGLGGGDVGDVDGVLAAVVDPHRAVAVGVAGLHLPAQLGQRVVPVDRHGDLLERQPGAAHMVGEDPRGQVVRVFDQLVG